MHLFMLVGIFRPAKNQSLMDTERFAESRIVLTGRDGGKRVPSRAKRFSGPLEWVRQELVSYCKYRGLENQQRQDTCV